MAGEQIMFNSCQDVDEFFREGRSYFNERYLKKLAVNSLFFNRVNTETWPMNSSPTQTGFRFGRGWYDPTAPWRTVVADRCELNSCDSNFEEIASPGNESYTWNILSKDMKTRFYCLTDWLHRLFPVEQIMHIEDTNINITRNVHEEFTRANYLGNSQYRWVGVADPDNPVACDPDALDSDGWRLGTYTGSGEGGFDTRYVYVKMAAADLVNIAQLSLDQLDFTLQMLQFEDDAYRLDIAEAAGEPLLDIIIPDQKVGRSLWLNAKQQAGWWDANTDFDDKMKKYGLGIRRVIGNYAFSYDINGLRYNVDSAYNAGLAAFDPTNQATWPRLTRVFAYVPSSIEIGCNWIPNPEFLRADFALSLAWVPNALTKWVEPSFSGAGDATMPTQNFAGEWQWKNPDWDCNIKRNQGFFWNQFRLSMQIIDPTIMHSYLHRLPKGANLVGACCPINETYVAPTDVDCFTCEGVEEEA